MDEKIKTLQELALAGEYPPEAFEFVQTGLRYTASKLHNEMLKPDGHSHISGAQLCVGLREYALSRWGIMARVVLERWNITRTLDFGHIVFTLVKAGKLGVTDKDSIDDFRDVFDFDTFERGYNIQSKL